jgi:peptide-methionine (R)-S-oxide reductase
MDKDQKLKTFTEEELNVTQHGGTETPFQNKYWDNTKEGGYRCRVCGALLFESGNKLNSSVGPAGLRGWPAFENAIPESVLYKEDKKLGYMRTEVVCAKCDAHLGHLFDDKETSTGKHYCINSCSLDFEEGK